MKTEYKPIYKIAGKIQYLTEVLPQIETNTILCKTLTGLGATYSEIKAKRHSVIIVPNVPPIIGKCKDPKHKNDNLFGVKQGVTTEEVIDYIEKTLAAGKFIKLISTPEGFAKIKRAFVSFFVFFKVSACAFPRPSATDSAKFANNNVTNRISATIALYKLKLFPSS